MNDAPMILIAVAFMIAAIFVWVKTRAWRSRPAHVHNWDYRGENRWSQERMRMEHVEYCLAARDCDQIMRLVPWEKKEYGIGQH